MQYAHAGAIVSIQKIKIQIMNV